MHISFTASKDAVFIGYIVIMVICMLLMSKSSAIIASVVVILSLSLYYFISHQNEQTESDTTEGLTAFGMMESDASHINGEISDGVNIPITTIIDDPISAEACDRMGFLDRTMDSEGRPVNGYMSMAEEYPIANKDVYALAGEGRPGSEKYDQQYPWGSNQSYTDCYPGPNRELNGCNINGYVNIDEGNARQVAMRTRDKKVLDGAVTKNANYYKKNFGKEFEESEAKRWWGNDEF